MKHILLYSTLLTSISLIACEATPATPPSPKAMDDVMMEKDTMEKQETTKGEAMTSRTITVESRNWEFSPNVIRIKKGENITLKLQGIEGKHGFAVPNLGIRQEMDQGSVHTVTIPTERAGKFDFFCFIPCGPGHSDMNGTIIIEE